MLIKADVVVGEATTQVLVVSDEIRFCIPVFKVVDEKTEAKITGCHVCQDKVVFNGELQKNIIYKEPPNTCNCQEGHVVYHELVLPFAGFVEIPGARVGDICEVEFAGVKDGCNFLIPLEKDEAGSILRAKQKMVVEVTIKVLRLEQIEVALVAPVTDPYTA